MYYHTVVALETCSEEGGNDLKKKSCLLFKYHLIIVILGLRKGA